MGGGGKALDQPFVFAIVLVEALFGDDGGSLDDALAEVVVFPEYLLVLDGEGVLAAAEGVEIAGGGGAGGGVGGEEVGLPEQAGAVVAGVDLGEDGEVLLVAPVADPVLVLHHIE